MDKNQTDAQSNDFQITLDDIIKSYRKRIMPKCPACGSNDTAVVGCGLVRMSMALAASTRKYHLRANDHPGDYYCRSCKCYFSEVVELVDEDLLSENQHITKKTSNGDTYIGEVADKKPNGKGSLYSPSGRLLYNGQWVQGRREGNGIGYEYFYDKTIEYSGEWKNGVKNGCASVIEYNQVTYATIYRNGELFKRVDSGKIVGNVDNGYGEMISPEGWSYKGQWKNGKRHGQGSCVWDDGKSQYDGHWKFDFPDGKGTGSWADGSTCTGQWKKGEQSGKCTLIGADGSIYEGDMCQGYKNGKGVITWPNGEKFDGYWMDDNIYGQGVYTWPDGKRYEGEMYYNFKHGSGILEFSNGTKIVGEWQDGRPQRGQIVFINGSNYGFETVETQILLPKNAKKRRELLEKTNRQGNLLFNDGTVVPFIQENGKRIYTGFPESLGDSILAEFL